jgi:lipopolysaccharide exporter
MAFGVIWMVAFKLLERGMGMISMLILARLLLPEDFGLIAMATSLIALLELFTAFGADTALIQRANPSRDHYNSAWTLNALAGVGVGTCMIALAIPAAHFYNESRVEFIIYASAFGAMVQGHENIGVVNFRKEMRFDKEFRFMLGKKLLGFLVTIPLVFLWRNYWALVMGMVVGRIGGVAMSYILHPFRPRYSLAAAKDLMNVTKWLLTQNLITFVRERSSDFVIGRMIGSHALGIFTVSAEISNMPGTELVAPINRAILPAYVKLADDVPALGREYLSVMAMISLVAIPAVAGFAACSSFLVLLVLGPNWIEAALLLQILAFFGILQVMQSNAYSAFIALNRHQVFVKINGLQVAILVPLMVAGVAWNGLRGAALAYVATAMIILPIALTRIARLLNLKFGKLFRILWRPAVASAVMYMTVRTLGPPVPQHPIEAAEAATSLVTCIAIGVPAYVLSVLIFWFAAGRPQGTAESWILGNIPLLVRRVRGAIFGSGN